MKEFSFAPRFHPYRVTLCKIASDGADFYVREARKAGYDVLKDEKRGLYFVIVLSYRTCYRKEK